MSKKSKPSAALPLSNVRVLVGRARHQASALSGELSKLGAEVIEIPFIEIRKPKSFKPLDAALKNLESYDWLILTSVNGVEAMWERMKKLNISLNFRHSREGQELTHAVNLGHDQERHELTHSVNLGHAREGHEFTRAGKRRNAGAALAAEGLRIAAIGPATKKAIEDRGARVEVVPKEYVAESVVRSLRRRVKGKRVLLVRAKVARDVIPRELRAAGAHLDVVEAYETVVPESSRKRLRTVLKNQQHCPQVITFTSSSTVRNFIGLLGGARATAGMLAAVGGRGRPPYTCLASIGPVTSSTLREMGLHPDISALEFTIPGLVEAIVRWASAREKSTT